MTTLEHSHAPTGEAFCTAGTSPTSRRATTIHLVGPGQVGRAFLRLLPDSSLRLVGISDTSATLHARDGLDPVALAEHKAGGGQLRDVAGAESLPVDLAIDLVGADVVVDATPTDVDDAAAAVRRCLRVVRRGVGLALAAKDTLCVAAEQLLAEDVRHLVGLNAVLGGTGAALVRELAELRRECVEVALVGNASTTAVIETVEDGGTIEAGIRRAQRDGVLEPDPELDLSGKDAAVKVVSVVGALWQRSVNVADVACEHLLDLDPVLLRRRRRAGETTRLVARASRGGTVTIAFEALPRASALAVPPTRVVYTYGFQSGATRVHVGHGVGPLHTARALLGDVRLLAGRRSS